MHPLHIFQVDRLMELHFKYLEKVHAIDNIIEKEKEVSTFFVYKKLTKFLEAISVSCEMALKVRRKLAHIIGLVYRHAILNANCCRTLCSMGKGCV